MKRQSHTPIFVASALAALLLASIFAATAAAAEVPAPFSQFPPEGEAARSNAAGKLSVPRAVVSSPSGDRVYVSDAGSSQRINVFGPWGQFREAFGWGVKDGSNEFQACTAATGCQQGLAGSGRGQFNRPEGLAVDSAGNLYIEDVENHRVQKFSPSGEFMLMFGGGVNETSGGNVCPRPGFPADVCKAGTTGSADGQFETWLAGDLITVGAGDLVYVGDKNRIQVFNAAGEFQSQIKFSTVHAGFSAFPETGISGSLAYDSASGDIYFAFFQFQAFEHSPEPNVYKLTPAGAVADVLEVDTPTAVANEGSEGEGNVFVVEGSHPDTAHKFDEILEFDKNGAPAGLVAKSTGVPIIALGTNRVGDLHAASGNQGSSTAFVSVYGPPPSEIEPAPESPPTIADQYAISASTESASVRAKINPHFFGSTTYFVEYGLAPCGGGGCASTAPQPLGGGEKNAPLPTAAISLTGLSADTTYHFRFVATSGGFTVKGPGEGILTTRRSGTVTLPDARAYEKVSPADKNNGEAGLASIPLGGGGEDAAIRPLQPAADGDAISFASFGVFGEAASGPVATQYLSRRGSDGWATENITPAARGFSLRDPVRGLSADLSNAAVVQSEPPLLPGATPGIENLYLRNGSGEVTLLTSVAPQVVNFYCVNFGGATPDFGRVIFMASGSLTPDAPVGEGQSLYEWTEEGGLALVSILPDGTPAPPTKTTGPGSRNECLGEGNALNAISQDGKRVFWTFGGSFEGSSKPLFARIDGAETIQLDTSEGGSGPSGGGEFWAASANGSVVFFTAPGKLVPGANDGDLYRYDFGAPEGERLTDLSAGPEAAGLLGLIGASEDGSTIYFAAKAALSGEQENSEGQKAKAGGANVYRWKAGEGIRFVATVVASTDGLNWAPRPFQRAGRVSSAGGLLAFISTAPLTGFDNTDQQTGKPDPEVFLYDAANDDLTCASCSAIGARPIGAAGMPGWGTPFQRPYDLSEAGAGRLFFQSGDTLAQKDNNGKQDVYQFELPGSGTCNPQSTTFSTALGGCQDLISSGESTDAVYLDGASASGGDVFFATRQRLLPSDTDEHFDIYDARVGGGLPEPSPPGECLGEGCRPVPSPPSNPGAPASAAFSGPGNVKEAAKAKKHKAKKKKHRKSKKSRSARRQGGKR